MFFRAKGEEILAALSGKVIALDDVDSPFFSGKVVGDGVAIVPNDSQAVAPISGTVSFVGEQKHTYGITGYDGVEVLIHLGIGSVSLEGLGFSPCVKAGDKVQAGEPICTVDWDLLKSKGIDITSPVLITSNAMDNIKRLTITEGAAIAGKTVCMRYVNK